MTSSQHINRTDATTKDKDKDRDMPEMLGECQKRDLGVGEQYELSPAGDDMQAKGCLKGEGSGV